MFRTRYFPCTLPRSLADALTGMIAASQKAVGMARVPWAIQVGQSGTIVSPAPICSLSDIAVEGDGRAFVEGLREHMEASHTQADGDRG